MLRGLQFHRVFFADIAKCHDIGMPEERVGVEIHFRIQADQITIFGDNERIDLNETGVFFHHEAIEITDKLHAGVNLFA